MTVVLLTPAEAAKRMAMMRPYLSNFAFRSRWRMEPHQVETDLCEGTRQAWWVVEGDTLMAVALTQVSAFGGVVEITACAGRDCVAWRDDLLDAIEAWARRIGARHVMPNVRPGWAKWLASRGYRNTHREMERKLS